MNDRELLEKAAKAAGISGESTDYGFKQDDGGPEENPEWILWSPLTDDGDALRLAVNLGMMDSGVGFARYLSEYQQAVGCAPRGETYAATRRAIVRAAAEIGKGMP